MVGDTPTFAAVLASLWLYIESMYSGRLAPSPRRAASPLPRAFARPTASLASVARLRRLAVRSARARENCPSQALMGGGGFFVVLATLAHGGGRLPPATSQPPFYKFVQKISRAQRALVPHASEYGRPGRTHPARGQYSDLKSLKFNKKNAIFM